MLFWGAEFWFIQRTFYWEKVLNHSGRMCFFRNGKSYAGCRRYHRVSGNLCIDQGIRCPRDLDRGRDPDGMYRWGADVSFECFRQEHDEQRSDPGSVLCHGVCDGRPLYRL